MLELKKITKVYKTEGFKQVALNEVTLNFRSCEFASILGPSGSGKTTLLNIIGGLDQYSDGDLVINETSTNEYNARDWDSYRNHRVGFVFQSYNLINHQSVLANVELALTLSGVSREIRRKKAYKALERVGLKEHVHKRPNQLSGGQMQRVAIARAIVNDPDIILADEPTGALDSDTSIQVMEILKEISKEKLVIMVTHNPDLANNYSTRIIRLKDGKIIDDTNPYDGKKNTQLDLEKEKINTKKTSMNLKTALSLSLNNLFTKKGRTFLTAFAGSIGIIGIALILSLSNGMQNYIDRVQKETLSSYPLTINEMDMDLNSIMSEKTKQESITCNKGKICTSDDISNSPLFVMKSSMIKNNLNLFKKYLDNNGGNINDYVTDIAYSYNIDLQIYSKDKNNHAIQINPDSLNLMPSGNMQMMNQYMNSNKFMELIDNSNLLNTQYEILEGKMPTKYNELVLVANKDGQLPISLIYSLNIEDREILIEKLKKLNDGEKVNFDTINYNYKELVGQKFNIILNTDYYQLKNGKWVDMRNNQDYLDNIVNNALQLEIVGLIKVKEDTVSANTGFVGYTSALSKYIIDEVSKTSLAKEQLNNKKQNVINNTIFDGYIETYENSLKKLGIANLDYPSSINIYPINYEAKEHIKDIINDYNENTDKSNQIIYTDVVGTLMQGITGMVDVISYILIAFVAISLVVSSIMIAIITYISVLERTKEIGILRAIGASKKDVSRVFNAETMIEGFISGLLGIGITILLCVIINIILKVNLGVANIASLPLIGAIALIIISILLTVIAGLIPARMASKKDPVEALRGE